MTTSHLLQRSGILTGIACSGFVTLIHVASGARPSVALLAFAGLLMCACYGIDRFADLETKTAKRWGAASLGGCFALVALIAHFLESRVVWWVAGSLVVAVIVYTWRFLPRIGRIKDLPFIKPFYVGVVWTGVIAACSEPLGAGAFWVVPLIWCRVVLGAVASDLKDTERDRAEGVRTFPTELGAEPVRRAVRTGHALLALSYVAFIVLGVLPRLTGLGALDAGLVALALSAPGARSARTVPLYTEIIAEAAAAIPLAVFAFDLARR